MDHKEASQRASYQNKRLLGSRFGDQSLAVPVDLILMFIPGTDVDNGFANQAERPRLSMN